MVNLKFPDQNPPLRNVSGRKQVFCVVRKRWVALTPEEWVRQNFILYLLHVLQYPLSLISVERQTGGEVFGRFDVVVFKDSRPFMLVECKEMKVNLTESVISQVLAYNVPIQASVIVITNGKECYAWMVDNGTFKELTDLPTW